MIKFVQSSGKMVTHPEGQFYKVNHADMVIEDMQNQLGNLTKIVEELTMITETSTGIIDRLQEQLKLNRKLRSDSEYFR